MSEQPEGYLPTGVSHATLNPAFVGEASVQPPEPVGDVEPSTEPVDDTPEDAPADAPVAEAPEVEDEEPQDDDA